MMLPTTKLVSNKGKRTGVPFGRLFQVAEVRDALGDLEEAVVERVSPSTLNCVMICALFCRIDHAGIQSTSVR